MNLLFQDTGGMYANAYKAVPLILLSVPLQPDCPLGRLIVQVRHARTHIQHVGFL